MNLFKPKSTIILHPDTDDSQTGDDDDGDDSVDLNYTAASILTKTYVMPKSSLEQFGEELWNQNFFEALIKNANAPLDNVVSCKLYPLDIAHYNPIPLFVGNVNMNMSSYQITNKMTFDSEEFAFGKIFTKRTFLNYEPYLNIQLYLPFVGNVTVSPQILINRKVKIRWIIDFVTGDLCTLVLIDGKQRLMYNSQCGIDIPLSASNLSRVQANAVKQFAGGVVSAALGSKKAAAASLAGSGMTFASGLMSGESTQQNGTPASSTALCTQLDPVFIIERVNYSEGAEYDRTYGAPCRQQWQLGYLTGYTVCANVNISCNGTYDDKEELKQLLESGVYL